MSWLYLSHVLREGTPLYGGVGRVTIERVRSMAEGDSSNNSGLALPAHAGTHVDAPRHFDPSGAALDDYPPDFWQSSYPFLLEVPSQPKEIIDFSRLRAALETVPIECDLLLLRTGAEAWRSREPARYVEQGPGVAPDVAYWLRRNRRLKFLGMDFISVSSFAHRQIGRDAHQAFLGSLGEGAAAPILLVEDMALSRLERAPRGVWIVPMRYDAADGAPATVLANL